MEKYDVCIIGGGPSGYAAAMRALDFRKRVVLLERKHIGGAGIFNGALSSKTLWELSREYAVAVRRFKRHGQEAPPLAFDHIAREVKEAVTERSQQLISHMSLFKEANADLFEFISGEGRLLSTHEVEVHTAFGVRALWAENIVLATGSRPRILPEIPVDEEIIMTSDGLGALTRLPESIVILGAGVIGCEFATILSNFGQTRVHLIDKEPRILPFEDSDIADVVEDNLEKQGVVVHHGARLEKMAVVNKEVEYTLRFEDGRREVINVEKALISVGRVPNIENMGFDTVGLKQSPSGHVIDSDTLSNVPNIYAVGDLTADIALVNVGELEGRHAVERMYGKPRRKLIYENISTIMFLNPESAGVGINEIQAVKKGIPFRTARFDFACIPRATAMRRTQGFFKILVTDNDEMKILGMRALGEHASSAIQAVALLISMDKGIEELAELIHPHPSIIEGIQECVRMLMGTSIYKPSVFGEHLHTRRFDGKKFLEFSIPAME